MHRTLLVAGGALLLALPLARPATAQDVRLRRQPGPVRDAGTYHLATGTWTRGSGAQAALGPDVIYRNDAPSGYFGTGWGGSEATDEGVLPGTANPVAPGTQDAYTIDGFSISYCSLAAAPLAWDFVFYESYVPCDDPSAPANCLCPTASVQVPQMPAGGACWIVTIDLSGGGEFCMQADGGPCAPGYQGHASGLDHFGWSHRVNDANTGPLLAGDPKWSPEGDGTCYQPGGGCGIGSTGLGARDAFNVAGAGCFWFGGYQPGASCGAPPKAPLAQFSFVMYTDCSLTCDPCVASTYCGVAQNPNNAATIGVDTCEGSVGSINVSLAGGPAGQFCYLLIGDGSGTISTPPGAVGDLCLGGGGIGRYAADAGAISGAGAFSTDVLNALSGGGGGNIPTIGGNLLSPPCQTWNFQYWHRQAGGLPSTFSEALTVTFR